MLTVAFPSPASKVSNGILVTRSVKQTFKQMRFNMDELNRKSVADKPWMSCYVPAGQIESEDSSWHQIRSTLGIYVVGKTSDDKYYKVAICQSYIPWLVRNKIQFELGEPVDADVRVYGISLMEKEAQAYLLKNLIREIKHGRGRAFEQYCRHVIPCQLQIPLERAILNHHVLSSSSQVRNTLCQWLVVNALSLVGVSNCSLVHNLLSKDQDQLLRGFGQGHMSPLEEIPKDQQNAEFHRVSLYWLLFVSCGGGDNMRPRKFDPKITARDNANMIGSLVGISGSNRFGDFDSQATLKALSTSRAFTHDDIRSLDIKNLAKKMIKCLPIGFSKGYLGLPTEMLYGFGMGHLDEIRVYLSQTYRLQPSLEKPDNNILVLLTWSSITSKVPQVLGEWASSDDGLNLHRRLRDDIQGSQATEQLALNLIAWLCLQRLLPPSSGATLSTKSCSLADFDALLKGKHPNNECTILEHMILSFLQGLGNVGDKYQITLQLLETILDRDTSNLEYHNKISVKYWMYRTEKKLSHNAARAWTQWSPLYMLESSKSFLADVSAAVISTRHDTARRIHLFLSPALWYNFWNFCSVVVLYASILRYLESSSARKILLVSASGEISVLIIHAHIQQSPQKLDRWFLLLSVFLSILKFIFTCTLFFTDRNELIGIGGVLAFSSLIICGLQNVLCQIYRLVARSSKGNSFATWRELQDLKRIPNIDMESGMLDLRLEQNI